MALKTRFAIQAVLLDAPAYADMDRDQDPIEALHLSSLLLVSIVRLFYSFGCKNLKQLHCLKFLQNKPCSM